MAWFSRRLGHKGEGAGVHGAPVGDSREPIPAKPREPAADGRTPSSHGAGESDLPIRSEQVHRSGGDSEGRTESSFDAGPAWSGVTNACESAVRRGAWEELLSVLDEPARGGSAVGLRTWYRDRRAFWESRREDPSWDVVPGVGAGDEEWDRARDIEVALRLGRRLARMLLAVALLEPESAAEALAAEPRGVIEITGGPDGRHELAVPQGDPARDLRVVQAMVARRGEGWATAFVGALAQAHAKDGDQQEWLAALAAGLVTGGVAGGDAGFAAIEAVVAAGAPRLLLPLLDAPTGSAIGRQVRRWYASRLNHWTQHIGEHDSWVTRASAGCLFLVVASVADPATAVRTYAALQLRDPRSDDASREAVRRMRARGERWCVSFFVEADRFEPGWRHERWMDGPLAEFWLELARKGVVGPLPAGKALRSALGLLLVSPGPGDVLPEPTAAGPAGDLPSPAEAIAERLRNDPLAARALLTAGLVEGSGQVVSEACAILVRAGVLGREWVLDTVVDALVDDDHDGYGRDAQVRSMFDAMGLTKHDVARRLERLLPVLPQTGAQLAPLVAMVIEVCSDEQLTCLEVTSAQGYPPSEPPQLPAPAGSLDDPVVVRAWAGRLHGTASGAWSALGLSYLRDQLAQARVVAGLATSDPALCARVVAAVADHESQPEVRQTVLPAAVALLRRGSLNVADAADCQPPVLVELRTELAARMLVPVLRAPPWFPAALTAVAGDPDSLRAVFASWSPEAGRVLLATLSRLVTEGALDREPLVSASVAPLTRQLAPDVSRVVARMLSVLEFSAADATGRMPLLLGVLPTVHSSVAAVLRPAMIDAVSTSDLVEVARVVCARTEKAGHTRLVKALTAKDAEIRWGRDALVEALVVAAELSDESVAARARRSLGPLGVPPAPATDSGAVAGLWRPVPIVVDQPGPVAPIEPTARGLSAALSRIRARTTTADPAVFLDAAVRWAASDLDAAVGWGVEAARRAGGALRWAPRTLQVFRDFLLPLLEATLKHPWEEYEKPGLVAKRYSKLGLRGFTAKHAEKVLGSRGRSWLIAAASGSGGWHHPGVHALHARFLREVEMRLGEVPYLISTPTRSDGSLDFDSLLERLHGYGDLPVGPLDLLLALLRLDTPSADRAADADGIRAVLWTAAEYLQPGLRRLDADGRREARDNVHRWLQNGGAQALPVSGLVRDWLLGGGLPALAGRLDGTDVVLDPVTLPVPLGGFAGALEDLTAQARPSTDGFVSLEYARVETDLGVVPGWSDWTAMRYQAAFGRKRSGVTRGVDERWLARLAEAPSPGMATLRATIATLNHPDADLRLAGVDTALQLMGRGRWQAGDATAITLALLAAGDLKLARVAHSFEQVILAGGLQLLWPTALAVLDIAASAERRPVGLAEFTRMLRTYIPAVPVDVMPDVPTAVARLATAAGGAAPKLESAAFVAAANGRSA